ncbi:Mitochondrial inner membrane protease subunit 2 [Lamellibrachia satsuma]|nr:Mitochondrial inner membrane protease subunit 2 [Lamellibrachia satsuma]
MTGASPGWRVALATTLFAAPITVTFLDLFGYVAKVEGASMQPCLNPPNQKAADYVLLNRWKARNFIFNRGEVVSLT